MKTITYSIVLALWLFTAAFATAQEIEKSTQQERLESSKEIIIDEEKDALKKEVEAINKQLEEEKITSEEAENLKQIAAERRALNIENRLTIVNTRLALLKRNKNDTIIEKRNTLVLGVFADGEVFSISSKKRKRKYDRRTSSDFVFAVGFNNVITEGESLSESDFKISESGFAELGWAWKTRVFKNTNWLRIKYGFSFQFNGLKPTGNKFFVDTGELTELQEHPENLDKSKFRMDNLVFPVHFEFGPSKKIEKEDYFRYSTYKKIKIGLGAYAGFNLSTRQKLKFNKDGVNVKQKLKANYNTNDFIYGLSAYIGWKNSALYLKYDLNTIFKDNPVKQRNISLGLRFDMD
jgi:hypothetical protein